MKTKKIREKIYNSLNNSIPDKYDEILLKCQKKKGMFVMNEIKQENKRKTNTLIPKLSLSFALILLVFGITYFGYNQSYKVDSIIELDVNPSIEIKVNKNDRVVEVDAKNKEAKEVLNEMDLEKTDIDVALNAIIGAMVTKGYIDDLSNSILVSVENNDKQKSEELRQKLVTKINSILQTDKIKGSVLSQNLENTNKKAQTLAQNYNISLGKATLILDVLESNKLLTEKDLVDLSINEINVLSESKSTNLNQVKKEGTASTKAYIGKTKAKQIALNHAGETSPKKIEIDFDADNGLIVYEVDFTGNKYEYEYEVNAKTGKIVKVDKEIRDGYKAPQTNTNKNYSDDDYDDYDDAYEERQKPSTKSNNTTTKIPQAPTKNNTTTKSYISSSSAKQAAFNHAGVSNPINVEVELDRDDNEYSVEFDANGYEYDYEINATTGAVKSYDKEKKDRD